MLANENKASMSKLTNGPILISSQPLEAINSSQTSYASGLGTKANNAIKSLMVKSNTQSNPVNRETSAKKPRYRQPTKETSMNQGIDKANVETITSSQNKQFSRNAQDQVHPTKVTAESTSHEIAASQSLMIHVDKYQIQNLSIRSPTRTNTGSRKHRGYSLLNMPVTVMESDDEAPGQSERSTKKKMQGVTAIAQQNAGVNSKYPDLFFQGWSVQPLAEATSVERKRERRIKRKLKAQQLLDQEQMNTITGRDQGKSNVQITDDTFQEKADENQTISLATQKEDVKDLLQESDQIQNSNAQTTQSANQTLVVHVEQMDSGGTSLGSSEENIALRVDPQAAINEDQRANNTAEPTIEVSDRGVQKSIKEQHQPVQVTIESLQQNVDSRQQPLQILASSSIDSYSLAMKRNSAKIVNQHVKQQSVSGSKKQPSRMLPQNKGILKQLSERNPKQRTPNQANHIVKQQQPQASAGNQQQKYLTQPLAAGAGAVIVPQSTSTAQQVTPTRGAPNYQVYITKQPSSPSQHLMKRQSNKSVKQRATPTKVILSPYKNNARGSESPDCSNWQNSSQDRLLLNPSKNSKRNGQKKAPPIQPGLKRFKTQTKESQKIVNQLIPHHREVDPGLETSSFNEDLSKFDGMDKSSGGKPYPLISQNLKVGLEQDTDELSNLKELSVVESDNSDVDGIDTPAAYVKKVRNHHRGQNFQGLPIDQKNTTPAISQDFTPSVIQSEDYSPTVPKTMHIQVLDAEEDESILSKNAIKKQQNLATFDPQQQTSKVTNPTPKMRQKISYLSSNDSMILAKSYLTHGASPHQSDDTQNNILATVQKAASKKALNQNQNGVNMQILVRPTMKQQSTAEDLKPIARNSDSNFIHKRRSTSNQKNKLTPYKRSNTRDERVKKAQTNHMFASNGSVVAADSQKQIKPINLHRRMAKNMPMRSNRKVQQSNQGKYNQQFVDSDFYENLSHHRGAGGVGQAAAAIRMSKRRSTSPVSSQASTFLKQRSIRTRKSNNAAVDHQIVMSSGQGVADGGGMSGKKSSLLEDSDFKKGIDLADRKYAEAAQRQRKKNYSYEREMKRKQQRTEQMLLQKDQRVNSRMYQQQFAERREKQEKLLNRQAADHSDHDALAYAMRARQDHSQGGINNNSSLNDRSIKRSNTIKKQTGLETLRKVHDAIGQPQRNPQQPVRGINRASGKNRSSVKNSMDHDYRNNQKNRTNLKYIEMSVNSSVDEYGGINILNSNALDGINNLNQSYEPVRQYQQLKLADDNQLNEQSLISYQQSVQPLDQGIGDQQQQADYMAERGGQKLTSDDSSFRKPSQHDYQVEGEHRQQNVSPQTSSKRVSISRSPIQRSQNSNPSASGKFATSSIASRQFRVPKMRVPPNYQKVVERKYNMLQTDTNTYFLPGPASHSVQKTNISQPTSTEKHKKRLNQLGAPTIADFEQDQSTMTNTYQPLKELSIIEQRKKSHELNSVRNAQQSDMDRIKKLTDFSVTKKIEKNRAALGSGGGRDDPSNVLGFQNMRQWQPLKTDQRLNQPRNRTAVGQLDPLKDRRVVLTSGSEAMQKNIYGMLSDLNRAKTMRFANQVLKEQKQQFYAVQHRREQLNSQGYRKTDLVDEPAQNLALFSGQSPTKRPSLEIQTTMPSIPPAPTSNHNNVTGGGCLPSASTSGIFTPVDGASTRQRNGDASINARKNQTLLQPSQAFPGAYGARKDGSSCATKPETPLANTGLRIIQTNLKGRS